MQEKEKNEKIVRLSDELSDLQRILAKNMNHEVSSACLEKLRNEIIEKRNELVALIYEKIDD